MPTEYFPSTYDLPFSENFSHRYPTWPSFQRYWYDTFSPAILELENFHDCGRKSAGTPKAPILASTLPETYCNSKLSLEKPMRWKMKLQSFLGKSSVLILRGPFCCVCQYCPLSWLLFVAEVCIVLAPWIPWIPQVFFGGIWIRLWYNSLLVSEFGKRRRIDEGFLWIFSTRRWEELPPTPGFDLMIRVTRSPAFSLTFIGFWESPTNSLYSFATVKRWVGDIYIYIYLDSKSWCQILWRISYFFEKNVTVFPDQGESPWAMMG